MNSDKKVTREECHAKLQVSSETKTVTTNDEDGIQRIAEAVF